MTQTNAYAVVVPPELEGAWAALPASDHDRLNERLERAARRATTHPAAWPVGPAGMHRGRHRAIVDELWLLYGLNDSTRTISLIGFGRVVREPRS